MIPKLPFEDRVKFFLERQFVKGASYQLLIVAGFIGLISVTGGALLLLTEEDGFASAVWWAFLRLTDPGYLGDDEGTWRRIVSTWLTVSGYVVFLGALVAIMTRWLIDLMGRLERGLTPVSLRQHIVVLGWNSRSIPLLQELNGSEDRVSRFLHRHNTRRLRMVVLSDEVSAERLHQFRQESGLGKAAEKIIFRSGSPLQSEALHRAACLNASAIIIPADTHEQQSLVSSDMETIKALLSIRAEARSLSASLPFVVAEMSDKRKIPIVSRAYPGDMEVLASDTTISRLLVQNVMHPGMTALYNEVLSSPVGNEFFLQSAALFKAETLADVACQTPRAILCGLLRKTDGHWRPWLNAPSSTTLNTEDLLVFLTSGHDNTLPAKRSSDLLPAIDRPQVSSAASKAHAERIRLLVLGWNRRVPALLDELGSYSECQFDVSIVSTTPVAQRHEDISRYTRLPATVSHELLEGDFMLDGELRALEPERYDSVILSSSDRVNSKEEADARALVGSLLLEEVLQHTSNRPKVIVELGDASNELLLAHNGNETLISSRILSHMLAQIALRRELRVVYDELFTTRGAEIVFRDPAHYGVSANELSFKALETVIANAGDTALGIFYGDINLPANERLLLNPSRAATLTLNPGDRLVAMTTLD